MNSKYIIPALSEDLDKLSNVWWSQEARQIMVVLLTLMIHVALKVPGCSSTAC